MITLGKNDIGSIYCIGRNYAAHAKELNNPIPKEPVIFTKVPSTVCALADTIALPEDLGRCDHETEIVIRIGKDLYQCDKDEAKLAISHIGLGLDLTLREKQSELKQQKYPWELAKNFINACPLTPFIEFDQRPLDDIAFSLSINGKKAQQGNSGNMLFDILTQIEFLSSRIPLRAGDLLMTGTPEGVGPLHHDDELILLLNNKEIAQAKISRR